MEIKINQNTSNYIECDNCKYCGKTYCCKYNELKKIIRGQYGKN